MIAVLRRTPGKIISLGFLSIGIFVLMQVILPITSFEIAALDQKYGTQVLISPKQKIDRKILGISVQNKDNFPAFTSYLKRETQPNYDRFSLSVSALRIEKSDVWVDTNDLSEGLIHLPGSALPGEKGNVFISGHSALNQFFWQKNAVFAKLADLKKGDQITLETLGSKFVYEVVNFKVVDPQDLSVILPPEDQGRYISLMTCVPPGLNFKRLIVLGKMI